MAYEQLHPVESQEIASTKKSKEKERKCYISSTKRELFWRRPYTIQNKDVHYWRWVTLIEASSSSRVTNTFLRDGNYFFSVANGSVKIYSTSSGVLLSKIQTPDTFQNGHKPGNTQEDAKPISAALLHTTNPLQILTAALDGFIRVWDYSDGTLLQSIHVGVSLLHMCSHSSMKGQVFVATAFQPFENEEIGSRSISQKGGTCISRVIMDSPMTSGDTGLQRPTEMLRVGVMDHFTTIAISPNGAWLIGIGGRKVYVLRITSLHSGFTTFGSPENLTCLAIHPSSEYFATGDELGRIRLWYCLDDGIPSNRENLNQKAPTTVLHWHAHSVSSIAFTSNGAYLLSGGEESVLVIWQLHSGTKEFLPRIGAPIIHIAINNESESEEYLLTLANNSFVFIDASTLTISRVFPQIRLDSFEQHQRLSVNMLIPLAYHSLSSTLLLPSSHPSSIQSYSPKTSTLLAEIEVSPSNRVSRRDEKPIEPSRVELTAVAASGEWMATVDRRDGGNDYNSDVHLKLWHWKMSNWVLNTRINQPHGPSYITSIAISPRALANHGIILATAGLDGLLKTWCRSTAVSKVGKDEDFWIQRSTVNFQTEIPSDISWSPDASLLGVTFGPYVAIYQSSTNALVDTLLCFEIPDKDNLLLRFVGSSGRYLLVTGRKDAVFWDLTNRSIHLHFHSPQTIVHIVPHPNLDTVAILMQGGVKEKRERYMTSVVLLEAGTCEINEAIVLPYRVRAVIWYPGNLLEFSLAAITENWSLVLLGKENQTFRDRKKDAHGFLDTARVPQSKTIFQDIFGKSALLDLSSTTIQTFGRSELRSRDLSVLPEVPAYLSPPIDTIYQSLIESYLSPINQEERRDEVVEKEERHTSLINGPELPKNFTYLNRDVNDEELERYVSVFSTI